MTTKVKAKPIPNWIKKRRRLELVYRILRKISKNWIVHKNSSMAAAISYRAMFSLVPIILLLSFIARILKGGLAIGDLLAENVTGNISAETLESVQVFVETRDFQNQFASPMGVVLGFVVILFGASTVFRELTLSFNTIWEDEDEPGIKVLVYRRLFAFLLVLGIGVFIVAALAINWILSIIEHVLTEVSPLLGTASSLLDYLIIPVLLIFLFAFLFKYLPYSKIKWRDVLLSAFITMALFTIGQLVLGWYLKNSDLGSYYGSMASFIIFMLWVYYSSMIVLFGAELSKEYTYRFGSKSKKKKS